MASSKKEDQLASSLEQITALALDLAISTLGSVMTVDESGFPTVNKSKEGKSMGWLPECLKALSVLEALNPDVELPFHAEYDEDGREAVCWTYTIPGLSNLQVEEAEAEAIRYAATHSFRRAKSTKRGRKPKATLASLGSR
jgi:hypothetical protein